jgi:GR25 family glycosyltransferase involved in LPS biosynthesis
MRVDKIFCLSLEKDAYRRANFLQNFSPLDIPIEFHYGIDGNVINLVHPNWLENITNHTKYNREIIKSIGVLNVSLTNPEKACALGHMEIWNKIKYLNKDSYYIVCEDDSIISEIEIAKETIRNINVAKVTNGLIYFGYTTSRQQTSLRTLIRNRIFNILKTFCSKGSRCRVLMNEVTITEPMKIKGEDLLMYSGQHWGAFAYAITPDIANQLLMLNKELIITSDGTFRYARLAEIFPVYVLRKGIITVDKSIKSNLRTSDNQKWCFDNFEFG